MSQPHGRLSLQGVHDLGTPVQIEPAREGIKIDNPPGSDVVRLHPEGHRS
jgi:hypothetical protein